MKHFKMKYIPYVFNLISLVLAFSSCSDSNFLDKTKIDGSILQGKTVETSDPLSKRMIIIVQNFDSTKNGFEYFGLCSGVILNSHYVVTAAHCAQNFENSRVVFTTDAHTEKQSQNIYKITSVAIHEDYILGQQKNIIDLKHDIALLKLEKPILECDYDQNYLIALATSEYLKSTRNSVFLNPIIAGFGKNQLEYTHNDHAPINGILKKAEVAILDPQFSEKTILIDQHFKAGVCSGDSGGPLFTFRYGKPYLQGIAVAVINDNGLSNDLKCNEKGLFLNLDYFKVWISKKLGELKNNSL